MSPDFVPSSPQQWRDYASGKLLSNIPAKDGLPHKKGHQVNQHVRQVLVDMVSCKTEDADVTFDDADFTFVYTDVLVLGPGRNVQLVLPELAVISLYTRVLTSDGPLTLELVPSSHDDAVFVLFASQLDHPVSVFAGDSTEQLLDLGGDSGMVGVRITAESGTLTLDYIETYPYVDLDSDGHLVKMLATQLRIASTLFWVQPAIAMSLARHVGRVTCTSQQNAFLNIQASALLRQLRAARVSGSDTSYAPVLKLEYYKSTFVAVLDAASAFQNQYDRFVDNKEHVDDQRKAWDSMLGQAQKTVFMQQQLADSAKSKWGAAQSILSSAQDDLRRHQYTLEVKAADLKRGLKAWKEKKEREAIFNIFMAVFSFVVAIGAICVGVPEPAAEIPAAIEQVAKGAEAAGKITKIISKDTLENIANVVESIQKLLEETMSNVAAIIDAASNGVDSLPPFPKDVDGNADVSALVGVAAWDKWTLDIDDQLAFAVSESIDGASEYRLELRKHAIDGKLTTQAGAQAVKAGQEYVQVQLALLLAQADFERLGKLRDEYKAEEGQYEIACTHFYDRLDAMRTSVLIELRNIVWSYKFYTLYDSTVQLDPLKRMEEYKADLAQLVQEVEAWEEKQSSDKSTIRYPRDINDPSFQGIGPGVMQSLKDTKSASFTLVPRAKSGPYLFPSGPFVDGSNIRVFGMRVFLVGAVPKPDTLAHDGTGLVSLSIQTSGVYFDIRADGTVLGFTSKPLFRKFAYRVDKQGVPVEDGIEVDSITDSESGSHMDPPPFTQWAIRVLEPEKLDLTGMTSITLEWKGKEYPEGSTRAMAPYLLRPLAK